MNIAVIGAGNVGGTVGRRWAELGHEVIFGLRNPQSEKAQQLLQAIGGNVQAATIAEAVAAAPVVVLTTPWDGTQDAIMAAGDLMGKIVIDCTNPLQAGGLANGLAIGHTTSAGEQVAAWASGARVVKALNTTGSGNMANPRYGSEGITMFICGDDAAAKQVVGRLVEELGFTVVDAGALLLSRYLEPLAMLWVNLAYVMGHGPNIALHLVKR